MKLNARISRQRLKYYQKFTLKKHRQSERKFLVEGVRLIEEAVNSRWHVEALLATPGFLQKDISKKIFRQVEHRRIEAFELSPKEIGHLSDTVTPQGIVAVVEERSQTTGAVLLKLPQQTLIVCLDDVSDPGNVGTVLRICDWFGAGAVILNARTVELFNPKVVRASMGALFHLPVVAEADLPSTIAEIKRHGFTLIVTALQGGTPLGSLKFPSRSFIVFGNEARGVSPEIQKAADVVLTITRFGKAESLNVASACAVILASWRGL